MTDKQRHILDRLLTTAMSSREHAYEWHAAWKAYRATVIAGELRASPTLADELDEIAAALKLNKTTRHKGYAETLIDVAQALRTDPEVQS